MGWPFLYFADEALSLAELSAARLDGDLVDVGEAFMPADAVETPQLRAASVRPVIPEALALTRTSAAWVHGALADPPTRHWVQRVGRRRIHPVIDSRLRYSDQPLDPDVVDTVSGIRVTTPARTLADLVRDMCRRRCVSDTAVDALRAWRPLLAAEALELLADGPPLHYKRPAIAYLRRVTQEEVTR